MKNIIDEIATEINKESKVKEDIEKYYNLGYSQGVISMIPMLKTAMDDEELFGKLIQDIIYKSTAPYMVRLYEGTLEVK